MTSPVGEIERAARAHAAEIRDRLRGTRSARARISAPVVFRADQSKKPELPTIPDGIANANCQELLGKIVERLVKDREVPRKRDILNVTGRPLLIREDGQDDKISVRSIIRAIEWRHGFRPGTIAGSRRNVEIVNARYEAVWVAKELHPSMSLPALGRIFNRDHTTILHAIRKYERAMGTRALTGAASG